MTELSLDGAIAAVAHCESIFDQAAATCDAAERVLSSARQARSAAREALSAALDRRIQDFKALKRAAAAG